MSYNKVLDNSVLHKTTNKSLELFFNKTSTNKQCIACKSLRNLYYMESFQFKEQCIVHLLFKVIIGMVAYWQGQYPWAGCSFWHFLRFLTMKLHRYFSNLWPTSGKHAQMAKSNLASLYIVKIVYKDVSKFRNFNDIFKILNLE